MRFGISSSFFLLTCSILISIPSSTATTHSNSPLDQRAHPNHKSHVPQSSGPLVGKPSPEQLSQQAQVFANISKAQDDGTAERISDQAKQGKSSFTPLNPPSIPLAVRGPYLNAWAPSGSLLSVTPPNTVGNGGYLAGQAPAFWTSSYGADGDYRLGWNGFIRVDNVTYQWQGDAFGNTVAKGKDARQISMEYTATRSIFKFEADGVQFTVTFLTPITPNDYLRQSLPLTYLHFELDRASASGKSVQMYTDIDERWCTGHSYDYENYPMKMNYTGNYQGTAQYQITRKSPQEYTEFRQRAEWGSSIYAARNQTGLSSRNNNNIVAQKAFIDDGKLDTSDHYPVGGPDNAFAFAVDFDVKKSKDDALFAIGHLRTPYVNYIRATPGSNGTKSYQEDRYGYWMTKFGTFADATAFFLNDFDDALTNAKKFDSKINEDSKSVIGGNVGDNYAAITALSVRQAMATIEITVPYDKQSKKFLKNDTLIFLKEISSNGDMQTVDVFFPLFPLLTYLNPEILRDIMESIFIYTESGLYPNKWCVHDLGTYPNGFGHNDGNDETMQVEESGNMVNMALHYAQLVGNKVATPYLRKHYRIMQQWTEYLIQDSLIPSNQLSTDDFAGALSNQTNLAIKGIEGIAAMGQIATILGKTKDAKNYQNISSSYIEIFQKLAIDSTKTHTKLAYQDDKSWGTLYNLFFDRLLNLKLVPKSLYDLQDNYYPDKFQEWGLPLDSRHNWTKTDWEMFASATSAKKSTRNLFINKLHKFVSNGRTDSPFTDLMESTTGDTPKQPFDPLVHFLARPVVGGHFAHLALAAADVANGISDSNPYQYGPEPKKNVTDTYIASAIKTAVAAKNGRVEKVDGGDAGDDQDSSSESLAKGVGSKAKPNLASSPSKSKTYKNPSMTRSRIASHHSSTSANKYGGKDQQPFGLDL